jgi:hypothetical protein
MSNSVDKYDRVLDEIISRKGDCMQYMMCSRCPFAEECLPKGVNKKTKWSKEKRLNMATDYLFRRDMDLADQSDTSDKKACEGC